MPEFSLIKLPTRLFMPGISAEKSQQQASQFRSLFRKLQTGTVLAAMLLFSGCAAPEKAAAPQTVTEKDYINASVLIQSMEILNKRYVDEKKVSRDKLFEAALQGMASNLDPYSGYEAPAAHRQNKSKRDGETSGIGVTIVKPKKNHLRIIDVIPGSPAQKAKLRPGDLIISVNGKPLKNLNLYQCQKLLQGPRGSKVTLTLLSSGKTIRKTLIRKRVINPSVPAARIINGHIGYIRIASFTPHTPIEFFNAMKKIKNMQIDSLIIDLRNNPGGHVKATIETLSQLIEPGKVLFVAKHRVKKNPETVRSLKLRRGFPDTKTPIILLVNNFTASSAEIFSGALMDNNRAKLVGTRTFGKGTLLNVVRLANGGALRFSSGRYKTPSGKIIEGRGLQPDHKVTLPLRQMFMLVLQSRRYPGVVKPRIKNAVTDIQLEKAIELLTSTAETEVQDPTGEQNEN